MTVAAVAEADEVGGDSCGGQGRRQRHTEVTSTVDKDEGSGGRSGQRRQRRRTRTCATMAARPWTWTLRRRQRRVARVARRTGLRGRSSCVLELGACGDFVNLKICRPSLPEVLIGVGPLSYQIKVDFGAFLRNKYPEFDG
ncbi:unknown protein [Oryza sativa Japonica Group]|uniref:Uncharacterized protein n=1 Tax=Oryza sativa subsp. japonica TaxID=39947 RepID=Q5QLI2_ORYSJ|nr:unknown protein [Oryza sativa Japonica Group]BAD73739.1 unknown protein [Oryza sativa Japonica Group]